MSSPQDERGADRASTAGGDGRRALLVGVQRALDSAVPERPGTCSAMRRIAGRLAAGGWSVHLLSDDEAGDDHRPFRSNLLAGLSWLAEAETPLLVLSGPARDDHFLPRDGRVERLNHTAVPLAELAAELPASAGVILDLPADPETFEAVRWAIGAARGGALEDVFGFGGPTRFLKGVVRAVSGEDTPTLTAASLAGFLAREVGAATWVRGEGHEALLTDLHAQRRRCRACNAEVIEATATFCPHCGQALDAVELLDGGRYRLIRKLGAGGMGQVYLADDTRMKVRRAIKVLSLPPGLDASATETLRARMIQEARAAQALCAETHHVVQVYDVGYSPERNEPFLVMELLEGETLSARLKAGRLTVTAAVQIARQIAATLALAHQRGIVHRDLKPDNIMLVRRDGRDDFVKLLDFGLVKMEHAEVSTESGRMMGTLQYMPPEQLRGMKVDARADVFSFGAVLFECLSGQRANPGRTQHQIFAALLEKGMQSLADVAPELPEPLVRLVDRCLMLIPEQRPPNGRAISDVLESFDSRPFAYPTAQSGGGRAVTQAATADQPHDVDGPALATAETLLPSGRPPRAGSTRLESVAAIGPVGPSHTAPSGAGRRRWLLLLPLTLVALGLWVWLSSDGPPPTLPPPTPAAVVALADATIEAAADAGAADAGVERDAESGPRPFTRPPGALPGRPGATRSRVDDAIVYEAEAPLDAFAALMLDVTLAKTPPPEPDLDAARRWSEVGAGVRHWLAAPVPTDGLTTEGGRLMVPIEQIEAMQQAAPERRTFRRLGTVLVRGDDAPFFDSVNCGRAQGGDRLLTARWTVRGYGKGRCDGVNCTTKLAQALHSAHRAGERLWLTLRLARLTEDGDESRDRVSARCSVGP